MNHKSLVLALLAVFSLTLCSCEGLALRNTRIKDKIEGYETFLEKYPDSTEADAFKARVAELRFAEASEIATAAAFQEYLKLHPQGADHAAALRAEDQLSFSEASATGNAESLQAYLDAHPEGGALDEARELLDRLLYREHIGIHELRVQQVNLANNPDGPLDGWAVLANVVNEGRRTLKVIELHIDLLDADGNAAGHENKWWAVSPNLGAFPTPEAMKPALAPGDGRAFRWTTGDIPENWAQKAGLRVTDVRFEY